MTSKQYIRRETALSTAINMALSLVFFLVVFGLTGPVPVWGIGAYVFDFVPQGFMIGLMSTLVPGALARKAARLGRIAPLPGGQAVRHSLIGRAIAFGLIGACLGVAGAAATLAFTQVATIGWSSALLAKLAFGGLVAAVVTPFGLWSTLAGPQPSTPPTASRCICFDRANEPG